MLVCGTRCKIQSSLFHLRHVSWQRAGGVARCVKPGQPGSCRILQLFSFSSPVPPPPTRLLAHQLTVSSLPSPGADSAAHQLFPAFARLKGGGCGLPSAHGRRLIMGLIALWNSQGPIHAVTSYLRCVLHPPNLPGVSSANCLATTSSLMSEDGIDSGLQG